MAYIIPPGSTVAFQGTVPWSVLGVVTGSVISVNQGSVAAVIVGGSIAASFTPPANQSVSGTVGASIIGAVPVNIQNSVAAVIIGGSIVASFTPPANQSVSGTVGASVIGTVPVTQTTTPWIITGSVQAAIGGSVVAFQGTSPWLVTGSVQAAVGGSVVSFQAGTQITSISGQVTVVSSLAGGIFPISGSVSAVVTNNPLNVAGSIAAFIVGNASLITVFQSPSIVGTYAEDAASASGDKGFLVMGARNDTLSSVTSNDGDYSSHVVGPAGELIAANAPFTKWVQGNTSIVSGASVAVIAAQGSSIFTYVTAVQITNTTGIQALVTFTSGSNSIMGYSTAPANGGSNIVLPNAWKTVQNGGVYASINAAASVFISASGFISKT